jgi:hypothetical protein
MAAAEGRRGLAGGEGALALEPQPQRFRGQKLPECVDRRLSGQTRISATLRKYFVALAGQGERVSWA